MENLLLKSTRGLPFFYEEEFPLEWHMSRSERYCFISMLDKIAPKSAIEIGTFKGGSLQVLSKYCEKVYSIDIDPNIKDKLGDPFSNVEYLSGDSQKLVPTLLEKMKARGERLDFVLIDGDHSYDAVRKDINAVLQYTPEHPVYIIFHDSFNPECRAGIKDADYKNCEYAHYVELDYVGGIFNPNGFREMWGGLALVVMLPQKRARTLEIFESLRPLYRATYFRSIHLFTTFLPFLKTPLKKFKWRVIKRRWRKERLKNNVVVSN